MEGMEWRISAMKKLIFEKGIIEVVKRISRTPFTN